VRFVAGAAKPDPAFAFVMDRRTNRNTYDAREVSGHLLKQLEAAGTLRGVTARTTGEGELAGKLRDISWRGHEMESVTYRTMKESTDLMRIGRNEVNQWRDGLLLEGQMMEFAKKRDEEVKQAKVDLEKM
jgi:hypothetical protein